MSGSIFIDSEPGRGSIFRIEIELPVVENIGAIAKDAERKIGPANRGKRRTILVVDDKPDKPNPCSCLF